MRQYESSAWEVGTGSAPVRCEPAGCLPSGRSTGPPRSNGAARVQGPGFVHVPYHGHQPRRKPGAGAATARTEQVKPCSRPWSGARSAAQRCSVLSSARPWGLPASGGASPQSRVILVPDHPGCRCFAIGSAAGSRILAGHTMTSRMTSLPVNVSGGIHRTCAYGIWRDCRVGPLFDANATHLSD